MAVESYCRSRVQKRTSRKARNVDDTNDVRQQTRQPCHADSSSNKEDYKLKNNLPSSGGGQAYHQPTPAAEMMTTVPACFYEKFSRQMCHIQDLQVQIDQLLRENESLRFQIQAQTVAFAVQVPQIHQAIPPQMLSNCSFIPVPQQTMPPQAMIMNNAQMTADGGNEMAMRSFQVTDSGCKVQYW